MSNDHWPDDETVAKVLANRFFWTRAYSFSDAFAEALGVDDDDFDAFEELTAGHRRVESCDDGERIELLSIPMWIPAGHVWEVELYDNGEDAGVTHFLHAIGGRVNLGTYDAHPTLAVLRWAEAVRIAEAAKREPRNEASGVGWAAPLLLRPSIVMTEADPLDAVRAWYAEAWRESRLVDADGVAAIVGLLESRHLTAGALPRDVAVNRLVDLLAP